jgi:hypothetical protein
MMSVPEEGAERLAEIFREILALSEAKPPNHSKSTGADDSSSLPRPTRRLAGNDSAIARARTDKESVTAA